MLEATQISFKIQQRELLKSVSLTLRPGEFLVLAGMNGAGKSTLLKILSGDLQPTQGRINLHGQCLSSWTPDQLARVRAVMSQENRLTFAFPAIDVVMMGRFALHGGYPSEHDRTLAHSVMKTLDIIHLENRLFPTLSGGERARVHLARALFQLKESSKGGQPPLLFLDEPTASLDIGHQQAALTIARDFINQENGAVCAVLHDLNLAAQYADRIAILHDGALFACGSVDSVLTESIINHAFKTQVAVTRHPRMNCPLIATAS